MLNALACPHYLDAEGLSLWADRWGGVTGLSIEALWEHEVCLLSRQSIQVGSLHVKGLCADFQWALGFLGRGLLSCNIMAHASKPQLPYSPHMEISQIRYNTGPYTMVPMAWVRL